MADAAQVRAVEANFVETWWELVRDAGGELHAERKARWFSAGDHPILNAVIDTSAHDLPDDADVERIASALEQVAGSCVWWVLPSTEETELARRLSGAGFAPWGEPWPGMAVPLDQLIPAPPVDGPVIERVRDAAALEDYLAVFHASLSPGQVFTDAFRRAAIAAGFDGDAPMAHFVARENGEALSCASLIVAAGVAGIYNVGTLETARGRGLGGWMSSEVVEEGRRHGLRLGVLQASKLGYRVYERLGFREVCELVPWIRRRGGATTP